jgi:aryl-alcohol dehydrogenase-like predicted oxidoreductase
MYLHSCPRAVLAQEGIISALADAVRVGKVRVASYSGDGPDLDFAISTGAFGSVETSVNLADQRVFDRALPSLRESGRGVIAKRPLANAPWRFATRPVGHYAEVYWERLAVMGLDPRGLPWDALALRFAAFAPGVSSAIVGTRSLEHLTTAIRHADDGPLESEHVRALREAFRANDRDWVSQV